MEMKVVCVSLDEPMEGRVRRPIERGVQTECGSTGQFETGHAQNELFVCAFLDDRRAGNVAGPDAGGSSRLRATGGALGGTDLPALRAHDRRHASRRGLEAGSLCAGVLKTEELSAESANFHLALAHRTEPLLCRIA